MGSTLWPQVEGVEQTDRDNSIVLRLQEPLDELATRLGVTPLTSFYDCSVMAEEFAEELELPECESDGAKVWSDPSDVIRTLNAILQQLEANPSAMQWTPDKGQEGWPARLREELQHCKAICEQAVAAGARFRLLMVP